ncbi:hypothetical protein BD626DRAFT_498167 [Schizophyllum amplum]|uniref:Zinc-ribbon 15 domain-containing protein n=1 Tax=Schizophyllum amplum TaxID=97359 RepID=A0A550CD14_9AGAR|nr:hypothetical protein BD626DRAFT_498167 [Auriculariopsis ampla]
MFICLPIIFGCSDKTKADKEQHVRVCPNCRNASVAKAKRTRWFELFWIPLIPFSSKHIWVCGICHWARPVMEGEGQWEPPLAGGAAPGQKALQEGAPQQRSGYQPGYLNTKA